MVLLALGVMSTPSIATAETVVAVQEAQIFIRPHPFRCIIVIGGVKDDCRPGKPISAAGELCQCNHNGQNVDGISENNPSFRLEN